MKEQGFIDGVLKDLSELKFDKVYPIVIVIMGFACPVLPMIFLYRQDILKKFELIGTITISLLMNIILVLMNTYIFAYVSHKFDRISIKNKNYILDKINKKLTAIEKIKDRPEKVANDSLTMRKGNLKEKDLMLTASKTEWVNKQNKLDKDEFELIKQDLQLLNRNCNLSSKINYGFKIASLLNIILGLATVVWKVIGIMGIGRTYQFKTVVTDIIINYVIAVVIFVIFSFKNRIKKSDFNIYRQERTNVECGFFQLIKECFKNIKIYY